MKAPRTVWAGPRIAVADSGVNPWHSHVDGTERGVGMTLDPDGRVVLHEAWTDTLGHGTAVAGVIREGAPGARIFPVKIFHRELRAPAALLRAALEWAIENHMKLVHLSLGTTCEDHREPLEALCRRADELGMVVVAAGRSPFDRIFPAAFETVIGVYWHRGCRPDERIHHHAAPVEFGAHGRPRAIPGLPQEANFGGASFAAARVTAAAAAYLQQEPDARASRVREVLRASARGGLGET